MNKFLLYVDKCIFLHFFCISVNLLIHDSRILFHLISVKFSLGVWISYSNDEIPYSSLWQALKSLNLNRHVGAGFFLENEVCALISLRARWGGTRVHIHAHCRSLRVCMSVARIKGSFCKTAGMTKLSGRRLRLAQSLNVHLLPMFYPRLNKAQRPRHGWARAFMRGDKEGPAEP